VGASRAAAGRQVAVDAASAEERMSDGEDYSRFYLPVRGVDESSGNEGHDKTPRVCKLSPFQYRGSNPWPFRYSIPKNSIPGDNE
jgi:hypothetical protein